MRLRKTLLGVGCLSLVWLSGCCRQSTSHEGQAATDRQSADEVLAAAGSMERIVVPATDNTLRTLVGFLHKTPEGWEPRASAIPPPWDEGNALTFWIRKSEGTNGVKERTSWPVVNMHAENYDFITHELGMTSIELHVLHTVTSTSTVRRMSSNGLEKVSRVLVDNGYAVITDDRIHRKWFYTEPKGVADPHLRSALQAEFPDKFRPEE